jgi:Zinc knuckle
VLRGAAKGGQQEKVERYKKSFDKGLQHIKATFDFMDSDTYQTKSPWDVYAHLVFKNNTSEGFCDALLALTESMPNSGLVELGRYTSAQTRSFLNDYFPGLLQDSRNDQQRRLYSRFARSQSQGLKQDLERITTSFVKDLTLSFSVISRSWTYVPDLLYSAFKDLAVDFEKSLGKEYDLYRWNSAQRAPGYVENRAQRTTNNYDPLSASLQNLSLSSAPNWSPRRPARDLVCFKCHIPGHISRNCQNPRRRGCYKCGRVDHIGDNCNF